MLNSYKFTIGGYQMKDQMSSVPSEMVAFVACAGSAAGKARFRDRCGSCQEAVDSGFVRGECKSGCVGVGSCIPVCKQNAIRIEDGKLIVDRELCNGCGDCAAEGVCPQHLEIRELLKKVAAQFE